MAGTGVYPRINIYLADVEVRRAVREHADTDTLRELARSQGLRTLHEDGMRKVAAGLTTRDELERVVPPQEESRPADETGPA